MKEWLFIIISPFLILSCEPDPNIITVENLNGNKITVLGHGGMGELYKYPGNTYESVEPVLRIGADGAELDVQITKDSILVLFHDKKMNDKTGCTGNIYNYKWTEIAHCKYVSISPHIYVLTVDNLFSRIPDLKEYTFSFDCKVFDDNPAIQRHYYSQYSHAIKKVIKDYDMEKNILIEASSVTFLNLLRKKGIQSRLFLTGIGEVKSGVDEAVSQGYYGVGVGNTTTKEEVLYAHANGISVMMWDAKTEMGNLEAVKKMPDFIQTDKPIHLLKLLGKYNE